MAALTVTPLVSKASGVDSAPVTVTSADTLTVSNNGRMRLYITSTPGATVTIVTPRTVGGLGVAEQVVTVPAAGVVAVAGTFDQQTYGPTLQITTSATIEVFAAV